MKRLFVHEEHEDGIAGKLLFDVTISHVDGVRGLRLPRLPCSLAMTTTIDVFTKPENGHREEATGRHDNLDVRGIGYSQGLPWSLALPRNDNYPFSQNPTTSSRAKRGDLDLRGVDSGTGLPCSLR